MDGNVGCCSKPPCVNCFGMLRDRGVDTLICVGLGNARRRWMRVVDGVWQEPKFPLAAIPFWGPLARSSLANPYPHPCSLAQVRPVTRRWTVTPPY